jgi:hypothetical protein
MQTEATSELIADLHRNTQNSLVDAGKRPEPDQPRPINPEEVAARGFVETGKKWREQTIQIKTVAELMEKRRSKASAQPEMAKITAQKLAAIKDVYFEELERAKKSKILKTIKTSSQREWVIETACQNTRKRFKGEITDGWLSIAQGCADKEKPKPVKKKEKPFKMPPAETLDRLDEYGLSRMHCLAILWSPRNPNQKYTKIRFNKSLITQAQTAVNEKTVRDDDPGCCYRDAKLAKSRRVVAPRLGFAGKSLNESIATNPIVGLNPTGWTGLKASELATIFDVPGFVPSLPGTSQSLIKGRIFPPQSQPDPIHSLFQYYLPMGIIETKAVTDIKDLYIEGMLVVFKILANYDPSQGTFGAFAGKRIQFNAIDEYYKGKEISKDRQRDVALLRRAKQEVGDDQGKLFEFFKKLFAEQRPKAKPLTEKKYQQILSDSYRLQPVSLDAPRLDKNGKETTLGESLVDNNSSGEDYYHDILLPTIRKVCNEKEIKLCEMLAGGFHDKDIKALLDISNPTRVRNNAMVKIRKALRISPPKKPRGNNNMTNKTGSKQ